MVIYGNGVMTDLNVTCSALYSCYYADIWATDTVGTFNLDCTNQYACSYTEARAENMSVKYAHFMILYIINICVCSSLLIRFSTYDILNICDDSNNTICLV